MIAAQKPPGYCPGGAAFNRAGLAAVRNTAALGTGFVGAAINRTFLCHFSLKGWGIKKSVSAIYYCHTMQASREAVS